MLGPPWGTSGGNQSNTSTGTGNAPSGNGGLGTGAKAGIAVDVILGIWIIALVFFLLRRRPKRKTLVTSRPREPYKPSDEKQVVVPVSSEISQKPELHNGSIVRSTPELHSEPVVDHGSNYSHLYPSPGQWQQQQQRPAELYNSIGQPNELCCSANASPMALHSPPRNQDVELLTGATHPYKYPRQPASRTSTCASTGADIRNRAATCGRKTLRRWRKRSRG
ncbi:uncharacterized protein CC84DRAFT_359673 [Paraphaeosphaeria sporulosa]|uniref:Uncharacterized protein n=1 Tax=Paraphaeosphaeria sporulosa TaxID=1460663 RepID=A0A177BXQ5_9PLEO|nr:uncharacterized protein CC84DRAFT_359673 [Paraphaeosphaeria sporulosa]OAG00133.1 hypothetical protein CC84DRAFT_359673 [Paraphaeosphaeria sporulosa]